jgi:hypothetical protein
VGCLLISMPTTAMLLVMVLELCFIVARQALFLRYCHLPPNWQLIYFVKKIQYFWHFDGTLLLMLAHLTSFLFGFFGGQKFRLATCVLLLRSGLLEVLH